MSVRHQRILDAAIDVFSRYGVRKATMGDIAEQAGISRQTLYSHYPNKEQVLSAAMDLVTDRIVEEVERGWAEAGSISDKLDIYFECSVIRFFEQIRQMPDSRELLTGYGQDDAEFHEVGEGRKTDLLRGLFEPRAGALARCGMTPGELADFVFITSSSYKFTARSLPHLSNLLATLKRSTLRMLEEA